MLSEINEYGIVINALGAIFGVLAAAGTVWWRVSRTVARIETEINQLQIQMDKMATSHLDLTKSVISLATKIEEREKGTMRLEGVVDATRKDMIELISGIQRTTGSLDAMWRTLQRIHPNDIPRRASDM